MSDDDRDQVRQEFGDAVNLTASALDDWLDTDESKEVGQKSGGSGESTGHEMGRRIVDLLHTDEDDLDDDDYAAMRKVVGYVKRHSAQRPKGEVKESRWRYSLLNWGHDPLK